MKYISSPKARGSRAVFQFYPENDAQVELVVSQAMRAGFTGGLVVDYPNSSKVSSLALVTSLVFSARVSVER